MVFLIAKSRLTTSRFLSCMTLFFSRTLNMTLLQNSVLREQTLLVSRLERPPLSDRSWRETHKHRIIIGRADTCASCLVVSGFHGTQSPVQGWFVSDQRPQITQLRNPVRPWLPARQLARSEISDVISGPDSTVHGGRGAPSFINGCTKVHREYKNRKHWTDQTVLNIMKALTKMTNCTCRGGQKS